MSKHKHKQKITLSALLFVVLAALMSLVALAADETHCAEADCDGHYENGFCTANDTHYQAATLNDNGTTDNTTDDYYEISNAGQLYWFAAKVNGGAWSLNGKLTADITVNENLVESFTFYKGYIETEPEVTPRTWTPIGGDNYNWETETINSGVGYAGTFDGDGKTISGLYYDSRKVEIPKDDNKKISLYAVGLFSFLNGATLKNITVTDSIFYSVQHITNESKKGNRRLFLGGIAGGVVAVDKATTIEGCTVKSSVLTAHTDLDVGNPAGYYDVSLGGVLGGSEKYANSVSICLTISDCVADNVTLSEAGNDCSLSAGGILGVGFVHSKMCIQMENCQTFKVTFDYVWSNSVDVSTVGRLGGIVGELFVFASGAQATIKNCTASHTEFKQVTITDKYNGCGGIVGGVYWDNGSLTIEGCTNASNVTPTNRNGNLYNAGGIVGFFFGSSTWTKCLVTIKNCANTGTVSPSYLEKDDATLKSTANSGGIVGLVDIYQNKTLNIENCYNTGDVSAFAAPVESAVAAAGGLVGAASGISDKEDAVPKITVQNCYNTGAVTAECIEGEGGTNYAGAVIGRRESTVTGTFSGFYYKIGTATAASGDGTTVDGATEKSAEAFASGEVCYLLNGSTSEDTEENPLIWKQVVSAAPSDESPKLEGFTLKYDDENEKYYNDIAVLPRVKGAQIRKDGNYGLRFGFVYDGSENAVAEYEENSISYGALLVPQDIIGENAITLETVKSLKDEAGEDVIADVVRERDFDDSDSTEIIYTAVLYNIPCVSESDNKYDVNVVAVPYVKFTVGGIEYTAYGEQIVRSVNQVKEIIDSWNNDNA